MLDGYPELIRAADTREFLYWAMNGQVRRLLPYMRELMNQAGNTIAVEATSDVAAQEMRIGEQSWDKKMVRWDEADARNRAQSDQECAQSGAELIAIAALSPLIRKEADDEISQLLNQCSEGTAPWRRGIANVAIHYLESDNATLCLQWLGALLHDEDAEVRNMIGRFFLYAEQKKTKLADDAVLEFARAFVASPALVNGLDEWRDYLVSLSKEQPEDTLALLEMMLDNSHCSQSQLFSSEQWMRLAIRLHTDPVCLPQWRARALSIFDTLARENSGMAHQMLSEWDRR